MQFPISGGECLAYLPPSAASRVSALTSAGGLSGAFLLPPFQVSVRGFTSPAATPTNLLFNVVAAPGGVCGYTAQRRMHWPLAWTLVAGTLPGIFVGATVRVRYLPGPRCDDKAPATVQGREFNRAAVLIRP